MQLSIVFGQLLARQGLNDSRVLKHLPKKTGGFLWTAVFLGLTIHHAGAASNKDTVPHKGGVREISNKKEDLDDLRQRIDQLKKDVAAGESARNEAADQLREHEKAISDLQRDLHELARTRESHLLRQTELNDQARLAEGHLSQQQRHLDRLLVQQYISGSPGPLHLLLSGQNPNQTARDMTYLGVIAQARQGVVNETTSLIEEKKRLADESRLQAEAIAGIEVRQREQQEALIVQRQQHQKLLAGISKRVDSQRKEIDTLRRDEKRLAQLIDRLNAMLAEKMRRAEQAKKAEQVKKKAKPSPPQPGKRLPEPEPTPMPGTDGRSLASVRGKLPYPATGTVSQKFGAAQEGGGKSKGIFIRSAAGGEVRSIADGQVVFADWLRGFGNLVVIDHGNGFLSVYGYNEAVLKRLGDEVRGGDRIASVGNSGGRSETGLYFELRRQGEAIDPGLWLRR